MSTELVSGTIGTIVEQQKIRCQLESRHIQIELLLDYPTLSNYFWTDQNEQLLIDFKGNCYLALKKSSL